MSKCTTTSRRDFLKTTGMGVAGVAAVGALPHSAMAKTAAQWPEVNTKGISNLKVVVCHDPLMIPGTRGSSFTAQNNATDIPRIKANLDAMAKELAGVTTAPAAWAKIFTLPSGKTANTVKAAIKVNCINTQNMPRIAVVAKVCEELINLGLLPSNIYVYDACSGATGNSKYGYYASDTGTSKQLPIPSASIAGWDCENHASTMSTQIPNLAGLVRAAPNVWFPNMLATGAIDILVNCAVNKNHDGEYGSVTLCMKNHFGTFDPHPYRSPTNTDGHGDYEYVLAINKHSAVLGGTPIRQQLCILDSLWASVSGGPGATPANNTGPARLIMGTFAPAVDYLTAKAIWTDWKSGTTQLKHTPNATTDNFLIDFGYTTAQRDALVFTNVTPVSQVGVAGRGAENGRAEQELRFQIVGAPFRTSTTRLALPGGNGKVDIALSDMKGRIARRASIESHASGEAHLSWDGRDESGSLLPAAQYILTARSAAGSRSHAVSLVR